MAQRYGNYIQTEQGKAFIIFKGIDLNLKDLPKLIVQKM